MSTRFIILNMERGWESNVIRVDCVTDKGQRQYQLKFGILGFHIPGELENVSTLTIKRSNRFGEIVYNFYEGINIEFPIDLSEL